VSEDKVISHQTVHLASGSHRTPESGVCVMELASMLAGEPFTDHPRSVCPVVGALLRTCNDRFDAQTRQRLLRYAAESVGTAEDRATPRARVARCAEVVRACAPSGPLARWRRRVPAPPACPEGAGMELFVHKVVRSLARTPDGIDALFALADELLAMGRAPAPAFAGATPDARTPSQRRARIAG
jgi:hypothetical protein